MAFSGLLFRWLFIGGFLWVAFFLRWLCPGGKCSRWLFSVVFPVALYGWLFSLGGFFRVVNFLSEFFPVVFFQVTFFLGGLSPATTEHNDVL